MSAEKHSHRAMCAYMSTDHLLGPEFVSSSPHDAADGLYFIWRLPNGDGVRVPVCEEHSIALQVLARGNEKEPREQVDELTDAMRCLEAAVGMVADMLREFNPSARVDYELAARAVFARLADHAPPISVHWLRTSAE